MVNKVSNAGDGVVVGIAILNAIDALGNNASTEERAGEVERIDSDLGKQVVVVQDKKSKSRFGNFGR